MSTSKNAGWLYVLADPLNWTISKIGGTDKSPQARCRVYSRLYQLDFEVFAARQLPDVWTHERAIHRRLGHRRIRYLAGNRQCSRSGSYELYQLSPEEAARFLWPEQLAPRQLSLFRERRGKLVAA